MLRNAPLVGNVPQRWADLGCGTGTFTCALAELLPSGSTITAMDRDAKTLQQVPEQHGGTRIVKQVGDFIQDALPSTDLDGILLANALHFVRHQADLIRVLMEHLSPTASSCWWNTTWTHQARGCRIPCPSPRLRNCSAWRVSHLSHAWLTDRPHSGARGCIRCARRGNEGRFTCAALAIVS